MYNSKRLKWHLDEGTNQRTPEFFWWSCKAVNELLVGSNRLLAASPRPRSPKEFGGFVFGSDRQGALADGLHGLNPRNTDNRTHPLHCRPALIERLVKDWVQRWNKAQSISESIRQAHLVLRLFFNLTWSINEAVKRWSGVEYIHPWRTYA